MTRVIALRPEPGLSTTLAAGREMGLDIIGAPLFEIAPLTWEAPDPAQVDALLLGSASAVRHGGDDLRRFQSKPAYVVGKTTEQAAREAGFSIAGSGEGGLQTLLDSIAVPLRLLRIAGAERVPVTPPEGVIIHTVTAYEARPLPLDRALIENAGEAPLVLLHSAAAARHFAGECDRLDLKRADIVIAALGPRIAEAAGRGWRSVHASDIPRDAQLLAMAASLCL